MLESLISRLGQDLKMDDVIQMSVEGAYTLSFDDKIEIEITQNSRHYLFKSIIGPCPQKNKEVFFTKIMEANLFGRGTRNTVIGLTEDENLLTLSGELEYNSSYKQFKEKLEDFVTIVDFWRNEALNHL